MAKIIINRKGAWMNRLRKFDVYIDGQKAGAVKNASAEEFVVPAGKHSVYCKLSWYGSNSYEVDLEENDVKFLQAKVNMKGAGLLYILLLIVLLTPIIFRNASWFNREVFDWIRLTVLAIVIIYGGYYSFLARKKYIWLGEDKSNIFNS